MEKDGNLVQIMTCLPPSPDHLLHASSDVTVRQTETPRGAVVGNVTCRAPRMRLMSRCGVLQ